jgi:putative SOS response-associated peptidase YedK
LLLAGFYREEEDGPHFTILTTEASDQMRPVHDRMPVMLGPKEIHPWIFDESHLEEFLTRPQRNLLMDQDEGQISMF